MKLFTQINTKWFHYGFETIAIIAGILIAFSLENWNEHRKDKRDEILILREIKENLSDGIEELERSKELILLNMNSMKIIIRQMADDLPYHDSLNKHFYNPHSFHIPAFSSSGFETLKSKGLGLITNEKLRNDLIDMFDRNLKFAKESIQYDGRMRHEEFHNSEYVDHFTILSSDLGDSVSVNLLNKVGLNSTIIPINYHELLEDKRYENILRSLYDNSKWFIYFIESATSDIYLLITDVEEEIIRLE